MSIKVEAQKSLKSLNTFGFDQRAELYTQAAGEQEIEAAVRYAHSLNVPVFVLGGGSNLVIVSDIPGLVLQLVNTTMNTQYLNDQKVLVKAGAGVNWHCLVKHTLAQGVAGLENLSLIPGSVGAAPVQNIGAYGVEIGQRIEHVRALHVPSLKWVSLAARDCHFRYRNSLFKDRLSEYIISEVTFSLGDQHKPDATYKTLKQYLIEKKISNPSAQQISDAVVAIRRSRLPDPEKIGNAGSFFHNPVVSAEQHEALRKRYPQLPGYLQKDGTYKLAAGWLIDNLGFKGLKKNGVGVHDTQALVLINTGKGTGSAVLRLASEISSLVQANYGVTLEIEPQIVGQMMR